MADRVSPLVRLVVPCEGAEHDSATGEVVILNPMSVVTLPAGMSFPVEVPELWVYTQLTEGIGLFRLAVEMRQVYDDDREPRFVGRGESLALNFPGGSQLSVYDVPFRIEDLPFDEPGLYEFRVMSDDEPVQGQTAVVRVLDLGAGL